MLARRRRCAVRGSGASCLFQMAFFCVSGETKSFPLFQERRWRRLSFQSLFLVRFYNLAHDITAAAHLGITKTKERVQQISIGQQCSLTLDSMFRPVMSMYIKPLLRNPSQKLPNSVNHAAVGYYAVQGYSRSPMSVPIESVYDFLLLISSNLPPILHCSKFQVMI